MSCLIIVFFFGINLQAKSSHIKLERGEKRFKKMENYTLHDFRFNWHITYMDIVNYDVESFDEIHFTLLSKVQFHSMAKIGQMVDFSYAKQIWLAKALLKKEYFWKQMLMPPSSMYNFTTLRFLEAGDKRFKAVSQLKDINEMLGPIDTEAKLHLWLLVKMEDPSSIYSYKKIGNLYRVRFYSVGLDCYYMEYFKFYDQNGIVVKQKKLKEYRIKNCSVIMQ